MAGLMLADAPQTASQRAHTCSHHHRSESILGFVRVVYVGLRDVSNMRDNLNDHFLQRDN